MSDQSHRPTGGKVLATVARNLLITITERDKQIAERDETIRQLRAQLDEYERAPTVAKTHGEYGDRIMYLYPFSDKYPPVGTELIARPARKGE